MTGECNLPGERTRPDDNRANGDKGEAEPSASAALEARSIENEDTDDKGTDMYFRFVTLVAFHAFLSLKVGSPGFAQMTFFLMDHR